MQVTDTRSRFSGEGRSSKGVPQVVQPFCSVGTRIRLDVMIGELWILRVIATRWFPRFKAVDDRVTESRNPNPDTIHIDLGFDGPIFAFLQEIQPLIMS